MVTQSADGHHNVQIAGVGAGASITVSINGGSPRAMPLERALAPPGPTASPTRLIRARSGVIPFTARRSVMDDLQGWLDHPRPFAGVVVGGGGGAGKTRLGVELCRRAGEPAWLSGLARAGDPAAWETLAGAPIDRLVVVDYDEVRGEQLEVALPYLAQHASAEHRLRVVLLVRARPRRGDDWAEALRGRGDHLDAVLDGFDQRVLDAEAFDVDERAALFAAAAEALARRGADAGDDVVVAPAPPQLSLATFASPLPVVIAAYLAVHHGAVPTSREDLLEELVLHEAHYWKARAAGLDTDAEVRRRVVGLASLAGAGSEEEAANLLRLVGDLADATAERRRRLARWVAELYPGKRFWNSVEPDLVGEHLAASCFAGEPQVLAGVLERDEPTDLLQPLDTFARAAADRPGPGRRTRTGAQRCASPPGRPGRDPSGRRDRPRPAARRHHPGRRPPPHGRGRRGGPERAARRPRRTPAPQRPGSRPARPCPHRPGGGGVSPPGGDRPRPRALPGRLAQQLVEPPRRGGPAGRGAGRQRRGG